MKCNYELKDLTPSLTDFYSDLLLWWERSLEIHFSISVMHKVLFGTISTIDSRSVFLKLYYENRIVYIRDLMSESDNKQSHGVYRQKGLKTDFLTWTGLRLSVPKELRSCESLPQVD